ncbi:hypothetical protein [Profundibacterium mesophilum]|uniref:Autotransporter domain-containing protein n=1 Tax=Profundibacterium mesophilum KAUST100406-0324 TaxID=1037889 RepID=A0A921NQB4_9RHOB|nr:hypothetical protein [Profundibacterium mesophilum]KAF0676222.1 hypothetical protein PMES_01379 [Profundibacterium mesophilum KAUST100406-0324]
MIRPTLFTATALTLILTAGSRPTGAAPAQAIFPVAGLPGAPGVPDAAGAPDAFAFEILGPETSSGPQAPVIGTAPPAALPPQPAGPLGTEPPLPALGPHATGGGSLPGAPARPHRPSHAAASTPQPIVSFGKLSGRARDARPLWTATGIADVTLGRDLGEGDGWSEGRAAFFAEGPLRGGWTLTLSADTGARPLDELFDGLGGTAPRDALERLRADPGIVTFGDESILLGTGGRDGRPYARLARNDSHLTFGQSRISLAEGDLIRADRSIYGLSGRHSTGGTRIEGFVSSEESIAQTDEFSATGGASYRLSSRDVLPGSVQLSVERRDENGRLLERRRLVEGVDYRINHIQGHVLLDRPLVVAPTGALFADEADMLVLRADYARPAQGADDSLAGLRAEQALGGGLRVGVTALRDGGTEDGGDVAGLDLHHDGGRGFAVTAEIARSQGRGRPIRLSRDGGLSFERRGNTVADPEAGAWRIEATADLERAFGLEGHAVAWAERREAGFAGDGAALNEAIERSGIELETVLAGRTGLGLAAERLERGDEESRELRATLTHPLGARSRLTVGVEHEEERGAQGRGTRTDLAARLGYALGARADAYVFAEGSIEASGTLESYERYGLGLSGALGAHVHAEVELGFGSAGAGLEGAVSYVQGDSEVYLRQQIAGSATDRITGHDLVLGARRTMSDDWSIFTEQDVLIGSSERKRGQAYGLEWTPTANLVLDFGARIDDSDEADRRRTLSFGAERSGIDMSGRMRLELHDTEIDGGADSRGLLLAASGRKVTADGGGTLSGRLEYAHESRSGAPDGAYAEGGISYALRPVVDDALVAVLSYDLRVDLERGAVGASDADAPLQRSHVLSVDLDYRLSPSLTIGAKYGMRLGEVAFDRGNPVWTDSPAHLAVLRADWRVSGNWGLLAEARALWQPEQGSRDLGFLIAPTYQLNENVKIGAGYDFGNFSSDLTDYDDDSHGIFVNAVYSF